MTPANFQQLANFIWSVADLLRGPYRPPQYERVMLPLTVLRRFDWVLEPTKDAVLKTVQKKLFRDVFTEVNPEAEPVNFTVLFPDQTLPAGTQPVELEGTLGLHADGKGKHIEFEPDPALKDFENIPLKQDIVSYFLREVRPYVSDAWIDRTTLDEQDGGIGKVAYEINFNREFLQYQPPRPLHEIDRELAAVERRIMALLREVTE